MKVGTAHSGRLIMDTNRSPIGHYVFVINGTLFKGIFYDIWASSEHFSQLFQRYSRKECFDYEGNCL